MPAASSACAYSSARTNCSVKFFDPTRTGCCASTVDAVKAAQPIRMSFKRRVKVVRMDGSRWLGGWTAKGGFSRGVATRVKSIGMDVRLARELRPARGLAALHGGKLGRRIAHRLGAEAGNLLA